MELLGLPYSGKDYLFQSEEIKQTSFRIDGLFKPVTDNPDHPLIFVEVQYQPDQTFYGRLFSEITLYLYRQKPQRNWLVLVIYPSREIEKAASIEFQPFMQLPQLQRIYLEDYQNPSEQTPTLALMRLLASQEQHQTITLAQQLVQQRDTLGLDALDFIETILVYKLPHLSREDIKIMLTLNDVELKQTRFYQEIAEEERQQGMQQGMQQECLRLLTRQLSRKFALQQPQELILKRLSLLPLAELEELADALLDFKEIDDFHSWLDKR
jgi:predicted transposase/invertase (TIGR01784 family)